jgi:hypothetical protein
MEVLSSPAVIAIPEIAEQETTVSLLVSPFLSQALVFRLVGSQLTQSRLSVSKVSS